MYAVELFPEDAGTINRLQAKWQVEAGYILQALLIEEIARYYNSGHYGRKETVQKVPGDSGRVVWKINLPVELDTYLRSVARDYPGSLEKMLGDIVHADLKNKNYEDEPGGPLTEALGDNYRSPVICEKILDGWMPDNEPYTMSSLLYALRPGKARPNAVVLKFDDSEMDQLERAAREDGLSVTDYLTRYIQAELIAYENEDF